MSGNFQKKTAGVISTFFIFVVVVTFAISGYQSGMGGADTVAKVGPYKVKTSEYQNQLNGLIQNYSRMTGGQQLSAKQIRDFQLKRTALTNIINNKMGLIFSDRLNVYPSKEEIAEEIKKLPYFINPQTKKFDYNAYVNSIKRSPYTLNEFEGLISDDIRTKSVGKFVDLYVLSDGFVKDIVEAKNDKFMASAIQFNKEDVKKFMTVTTAEIKNWLAVEENSKKVNELFNKRKSTLDQKEEVKARHILIKTVAGKEKEAEEKINKIHKDVNRSNFIANANKYTEDPSGKGKGGDLGWFTKGRMVKEFEETAFNLKVGEISKPVKTNFGYHIIYVTDKKAKKEAKFEDHEKDLAKELIQKGRSEEEVNKKVAELQKEWMDLLARNKNKKLDSLKDEYQIKYVHKGDFNRLNPYIRHIKLNPSNVNEVFSNPEKKQFSFAEAGRYTLIHILNKVNNDKPIEELIKQEATSQRFQFRNKLRTSLIDSIKKDISVTHYLPEEELDGEI